MEKPAVTAIRNELVCSLERVYQLRAFGALSELLQGEALILRDLAAHRDETVYPSALSQRLHLSRSRITGALNSLRCKGDITLSPSTADRRRVQVALTETGLAQIDRQMAQMSAYFDRMIRGLGAQDARALVALIHRCADVMEE